MTFIELGVDYYAKGVIRGCEKGELPSPELLKQLERVVTEARAALKGPKSALDEIVALREDDFGVLMATDGFARQLSLAMFGRDEAVLRQVLELCDDDQKQSLLKVIPPALTAAEVAAAEQFLFDRIAAQRAAGAIQPVKAV